MKKIILAVLGIILVVPAIVLAAPAGRALKNAPSPFANTSSTPAQQRKEVRSLERVQFAFTFAERVFQAAINRETELGNRIESRLNKLSSAGRDVSALRTQLNTARQNIKAAQTALDSTETQLKAMWQSGEKTPERYAQIRVLLRQNVVDKIKVAHQSLVAVILAIYAHGWATPASPSPITTPTVSPLPTTSTQS